MFFKKNKGHADTLSDLEQMPVSAGRGSIFAPNLNPTPTFLDFQVVETQAEKISPVSMAQESLKAGVLEAEKKLDLKQELFFEEASNVSGPDETSWREIQPVGSPDIAFSSTTASYLEQTFEDYQASPATVSESGASSAELFESVGTKGSLESMFVATTEASWGIDAGKTSLESELDPMLTGFSSGEAESLLNGSAGFLDGGKQETVDTWEMPGLSEPHPAQGFWGGLNEADALPGEQVGLSPGAMLDSVNQQLYPSHLFESTLQDEMLSGEQAFEEAAQFLFPETASAPLDWGQHSAWGQENSFLDEVESQGGTDLGQSFQSSFGEIQPVTEINAGFSVEARLESRVSEGAITSFGEVGAGEVAPVFDGLTAGSGSTLLDSVEPAWEMSSTVSDVSNGLASWPEGKIGSSEPLTALDATETWLSGEGEIPSYLYGEDAVESTDLERTSVWETSASQESPVQEPVWFESERIQAQGGLLFAEDAVLQEVASSVGLPLLPSEAMSSDQDFYATSFKIDAHGELVPDYEAETPEAPKEQPPKEQPTVPMVPPSVVRVSETSLEVVSEEPSMIAPPLPEEIEFEEPFMAAPVLWADESSAIEPSESASLEVAEVLTPLFSPAEESMVSDWDAYDPAPVLEPLEQPMVPSGTAMAEDLLAPPPLEPFEPVALQGMENELSGPNERKAATNDFTRTPVNVSLDSQWQEEPAVLPSVEPDWRQEEAVLPSLVMTGQVDVLALCPISADKRLMVVQDTNGVCALVGQVGGDEPQLSVIKLFEQNPIAYQNTFTSVEEAATGGHGLYIVQVGTWHAIVSVFQDKMTLHTELG